MSTLDNILGKAGDDLACKDFGTHASIHWYKDDAKDGDRCLCGKTVKQPEEEDTHE